MSSEMRTRIVQWTPLHRTAAEAVARVIYDQRPCLSSFHPVNRTGESAHRWCGTHNGYFGPYGDRSPLGTFVPGARCVRQEHDRPWVERHVPAAILWLGHLEAANPNERGLEGIVEAALVALDAQPESCRNCDCRHFSIGLGGEAIGCECTCHFPAAEEFFSALALEAIAGGESAGCAFGCNRTDGGTYLHPVCRVHPAEARPRRRVPSWFDTHPRLEINGRAFEIPPLVVESTR